MNLKILTMLLSAILVTAVTGITANGQLASAGGATTNTEDKFDRHDFPNSLNIDNKYFPLKPGTTFTYQGTKDGERASDKFVVTDKTKVILGVTTRVVHDTAYLNGKVSEVTDDWFAQDEDGNVWYLGEFTTEVETGSHEGSWQAGVNGAKPGIIMKAQPKVGDSYYQEFLRGVAEDQARVVKTNASVCVPYGCFNNVLVTEDFTALDPDVLDHKFYAPGIGEIKEERVQGGSEVIELVNIKK